MFNDTAKRLTTSFCLLGRCVRGFNGLPHAPEGSSVPLAVVFPSLTLKQLKHCANRVYRLPSGEFRFFVRDTHGNKHGLQSNHINAYRTDFSLSKNSPHKTVLLCLLMSLRCTCSFSRSSTADVLSLRPYAHTRTNLSSRSPSIAPMFSFQSTPPI